MLQYHLSLTIEEGLETISDYAISGCKNLGSVVLPSTVKSIGESAFLDCTALESINIPNGITIIENSTFFKSGLTSIEIPSSVTTIDISAFGKCTSLSSVTIPTNVTTIGNAAFGGCTALSEFIVPDAHTIYKVVDGVLCSKDGSTLHIYPAGLDDAVVPAGVTTIAANAFNGCSKFTTICIPEAVSSIGIEAFKNCTSLATVMCYMATPPSTATTAFDGCDLSKASLLVHESSIDAYKAVEPWSLFGNITDMNCDVPVISYDGGKLLFSSATPGAKFYYSIEAADVADKVLTEGEVELKAYYKISAYVTAEGYDDSPTIEGYLYFLPVPDDGPTTGVIEKPDSRAIMAYCNGGIITITGLAENEIVTFYNIEGYSLGTAEAVDGKVVFETGVGAGSIVIARFSDSSIKILVR